MATLAEVLAGHVREGDLWEPLESNRIRCYACGHRCPIPEGQAGVCKVRFNRDGILYVPWGYVAGVQCDPIEKKPFFHVRPARWPSASACWAATCTARYCQNWVTSQAIRDPEAMAPRRGASRPNSWCGWRWTQGAEAVGEHVQRAADHRRVGCGGLQGGAPRRVCSPVSFPTATPRREVLEYLRPWIGSLQGRSEELRRRATTTSWAAGCSPSWTASGGSTRWVSGWRW